VFLGRFPECSDAAGITAASGVMLDPLDEHFSVALRDQSGLHLRRIVEGPGSFQGLGAKERARRAIQLKHVRHPK